jgi:hypothetical protein
MHSSYPHAQAQASLSLIHALDFESFYRMAGTGNERYARRRNTKRLRQSANACGVRGALDRALSNA